MHSARSSTTAAEAEHGGFDVESSSATQLDFDTAMADFHTMFPDLDGEVIEVRKCIANS